ncbi:hypothetical protein CC79DRAFT_509528 [Sarocladium strictum]
MAHFSPPKRQSNQKCIFEHVFYGYLMHVCVLCGSPHAPGQGWDGRMHLKAAGRGSQMTTKNLTIQLLLFATCACPFAISHLTFFVIHFSVLFPRSITPVVRSVVIDSISCRCRPYPVLSCHMLCNRKADRHFLVD